MKGNLEGIVSVVTVLQLQNRRGFQFQARTIIVLRLMCDVSTGCLSNVDLGITFWDDPLSMSTLATT